MSRIPSMLLVAIVFTALLLPLPVPVHAVQRTDQAEEAGSDGKQVQVDQRLMYLLADDLKYTNHFLDFLEVSEDQRRELKRITEATAGKLAASMHPDGLRNEKVAGLLGELRAELSGVLVEFQLHNLGGLLSLRAVQRRSGNGCIESFPLAMSIMGLKQSDRQQVEQQIKPIVEEFVARKKELTDGLVDRIRELVPPESLENAQQLISLTLALSTPIDPIRIEPLDAAGWGSEEFDHLERRFGARLLMRTDLAQVIQYLALSEQQIGEIRRLAEAASEANSGSGDGNLDKSRLMEMAAKSDVDGIKQYMASHQREIEKMECETAESIAKAVLTDKQHSDFRAYASFRRRWVESGFEGDVGAILAIVPDAKKLLPVLEEEITRLDEATDRLSRETYGKIVSALPETVRKRYESEFGTEFYDYREECRAAWKKFRELRR